MKSKAKMQSEIDALKIELAAARGRNKLLEDKLLENKLLGDEMNRIRSTRKSGAAQAIEGCSDEKPALIRGRDVFGREVSIVFSEISLVETVPSLTEAIANNVLKNPFETFNNGTVRYMGYNGIPEPLTDKQIAGRAKRLVATRLKSAADGRMHHEAYRKTAGAISILESIEKFGE